MIIKDVSLTFKCSKEHRELIKLSAKKEGCSVSDLIISKVLEIPMERQPEIKHYTTKKGYTTIRKKVLSKCKK